MKVLICNRGEIALRILKATRSAARKIPTLVIYTEQDATTLPVLQADESVLVSSYLNQSEIIKIALENKCMSLIFRFESSLNFEQAL